MNGGKHTTIDVIEDENTHPVLCHKNHKGEMGVVHTSCGSRRSKKKESKQRKGLFKFITVPYTVNKVRKGTL